MRFRKAFFPKYFLTYAKDEQPHPFKVTSKCLNYRHCLLSS